MLIKVEELKIGSYVCFFDEWYTVVAMFPDYETSRLLHLMGRQGGKYQLSMPNELEVETLSINKKEKKGL